MIKWILDIPQGVTWGPIIDRLTRVLIEVPYKQINSVGLAVNHVNKKFNFFPWEGHFARNVGYLDHNHSWWSAMLLVWW